MYYSVRMRASAGERHISGAEGLYIEEHLQGAVEGYLRRARWHERGEPDRIVITIERITGMPLYIKTLPVFTAGINNPGEALKFISGVLKRLGISGKAIENAISVISSRDVMRGASLIRALSGKRVEPDMERGVRVTRLGIEPAVRSELESRFKERGLRVEVVSEALLLASKVANTPGIIAEICVSDDPSYTTGYVASGLTGYIRIPNIKEAGSPNGGRVFFLDEEIGTADVIEFLEKRPVIANQLSEIHDLKFSDFLCM